jgi:hypothetical protein
MADALKRMNMARTKSFQDKCEFYAYQKASAVFAEETPDADELLLAKAVWAKQVKPEDIARAAMTNSTIGPAIDNGTEIQEDWIEYAIVTEGQFLNLAQAYKAAGLIGA